MELGEVIDLLQQMVLVFDYRALKKLYPSLAVLNQMEQQAQCHWWQECLCLLICSARLAAWNVGEQTLAEEQLPEVVTQMRSLNQDRLLFIYDRGYPSVKFIQQHYDLKVDFIFRLQKRNYSKLWERWRTRF
jgi:hypothetical protein